jgi:hypothetical protein
MQSVKAWSVSQGWDYAFMDDAFFDLAPLSVREKCGANIYAVTDVCRLVWAKKCLDEGYDRVVWADADMLVFAPRHLSLDALQGHGFAREIFLRIDGARQVTPIEGINNALMFFDQGDGTLAAYLKACHAALDAAPTGEVARTALGPALLVALGQSQALNRIEGVGLFTQAVMSGIATGQYALISALRKLHGQPLAAANLCHFLRNATPAQHRPGFDAMYTEAVSRLLSPS